MPMSFSARKLYYALPPAVRFMARRLYYLPIDTWENLTGQRDALTPPRGMIYTGSGAFRKQGKELVERFVKLAGLQPHHAVLDIGSGIGRVAIPLTEYLSEEGRYEGFDVVEKGVQWCQAHITQQFPNFPVPVHSAEQ
jgi:2-polyprenyl-3-methyl-5-hydroxy-6-metoxy-1,4-benzoquinol methylase